MQQNFKTLVRVYKDSAQGDQSGKASIDWIIYFEFRESVFKGMTFLAPDQKIVISWDNGPEEEYSLQDCEIQLSSLIPRSGDIYPEELDLDVNGPLLIFE